MKLIKSFRFVLLAISIFTSSLAYAETVWIDVRSVLENKIDNIEGDVRISYGDIVQGVSKLYPDKNTDIRLYCLVGVRSEKALNSLKAAGYTSVINVGGIDDARKERGLSD